MAVTPPEPPEGQQDETPDRPPIELTEQDLLNGTSNATPAESALPDSTPADSTPADSAPADSAPAEAAPFGRYVPRSRWGLVNNEPYLTESGRPPGPGFLMALVWMLGVGLIQVVATVVAVGAFAPEIYTSAAREVVQKSDAELALDKPGGDKPGGESDPDRKRPRELIDLSGETITQVMTSTQAVFLVASVLALWLRYGRELPRRTPLTPPAGRHVVIVLALALPLVVFGGYLASQVLALMRYLGPNAEPSIPAMDLFGKMAGTGSFWSLLFVLAITPAIAEEIVFRGIVGRGLLARYGLVGGVLLTSLLFAFVHMHPAHIIGVIPIGIAMHVAYLATRSFWAPVLIHFLNNGLSVVMVFSLEGVDAEAITQEATPLGLPGALAALACVITLTALLWQSRIDYLDPDGQLLEPAYPTVEPPPPDLPHTKTFRRPSPWLIAGSVLSLLAFFAAAARMAAAQAP